MPVKPAYFETVRGELIAVEVLELIRSKTTNAILIKVKVLEDYKTYRKGEIMDVSKLNVVNKVGRGNQYHNVIPIKLSHYLKKEGS